MSTTVQVKEKSYQVGKLPARTQFHVLRRIAPLLAELVPVVGIAKQMDLAQATATDKIEMFGPLFAPLAQALANLNDQDLDYVMNNCLARIERKEGERWAPILAPDGVQFMFPDIDMPVMLKLTVESIKENMGDFFELLPGLF